MISGKLVTASKETILTLRPWAMAGTTRLKPNSKQASVVTASLRKFFISSPSFNAVRPDFQTSER